MHVYILRGGQREKADLRNRFAEWAKPSAGRRPCSMTGRWPSLAVGQPD